MDAHFKQLVLDEIASRRRHGLMLPQVQFRCNKLLLDHPERVPEGIDIDSAADAVEQLVSGRSTWSDEQIMALPVHP